MTEATHPDVDAGPASGVGQELARAREALGLSLSDVALQLKYLPRQLEALEQERFESLPGATIARGMVRNYARLLRLDPEPLLERLAGRLRTPDSGDLAARFSQPVPFSDSGRRSTTVYFTLSLGVLVLVAAVAYEWRHQASVPPMAAVIGPKTDAPLVAAQEPPAPAAAPAPSASAPITAAPAEPAPAAAVPPAPEKTAPVAVAVSAPEPREEQIALKTMGAHRIVLRCDQESWIEVKDAADRLLVSSLNPAGSERVVEGRPPFTLVIGNAQHVRVSYNDRPVDLSPHIKVEVARLTLK